MVWRTTDEGRQARRQDELYVAPHQDGRLKWAKAAGAHRHCRKRWESGAVQPFRDTVRLKILLGLSSLNPTFIIIIVILILIPPKSALPCSTGAKNLTSEMLAGVKL